ALVSRAWPVWGAALLVATVNVFLFAFDRPWTASDGLRNWGDWVLTAAGLVRRPDLLPPWLYSGSLLNLGVLLGGAAGALCAREFAIRARGRGATRVASRSPACCCSPRCWSSPSPTRPPAIRSAVSSCSSAPRSA